MMNQVQPLYIWYSPFVRLVSSLDVEGDRVSGFESVRVLCEILILVLGWSFPGGEFGIMV